MLLPQNFLSQSSHFVASTTQNYTSNNAFQSDSNSKSDFDMLLALNQNPTQEDTESQTPTEDLKSLAWTQFSNTPM